MNDRANPAPLGLMGFGMTTVLLNLHNAGFFKVGDIKLRINGSVVNTSDGSSLCSLLSGGKLIIPLLVKGGEQTGKIEVPVTPGLNSSSGTIGGGTLVLGQDGSVASERGSLEVEADLKRVPDGPGILGRVCLKRDSAVPAARHSDPHRAQLHLLDAVLRIQGELEARMQQAVELIRRSLREVA